MRLFLTIKKPLKNFPLPNCRLQFKIFDNANPEKYKDPGKKIKFNRIFTVQEIWDRDKERIFLLENHRGIKTVVVWESDYYRNKNNEEYYKNIIKKCIEK